MVVLLTDGVEDGDTSDDEDRSRLKAAIDSYEADGIPVIVLQLQPPVSSGLPRGRDPMLVELACRTGGEHLFLEQASEFTESRSPLGDIVRNRLVGSWVLRTTTTLDGPAFGPGEYFLSTQLTVQLGGETQPARLARNRDERLISSTPAFGSASERSASEHGEHDPDEEGPVCAGGAGRLVVSGARAG
ncbi:MAG: hypothetical protein R3F43_22060 [bacterium]